MLPIFIENSKLVKYINYIFPADIDAITIFPFVLASGPLDPQLINHEMIHYQQYIDTLVIGFWLIYLWDYTVGYIKYRDSEKAYFKTRAEQEAYKYDHDYEYLAVKRVRRNWLFKYKV